mmetsp:Transcript_26438/g.39094  ORF Transcript_26438/g.39094 Transcript_26438/m.39094 type:complete len:315 (+) Transcript_26438:149-1093(+)
MSKSYDAYIETPHKHDVLSGRGNFVNYHAGNEYFRSLVREHKVAYVACPKPQKGKYSQLIVDKISALDPPGRFLKQDNNTKLWYDIGEKKALDKTRQALREGAPDLLKEICNPEDEVATQRDVKPNFLENGVQNQHLAMDQQVVPDLQPIEYTSHNVALKGLPGELDAAQNALNNHQSAEYSLDALEPTPMNPNIVARNRRDQFRNNVEEPQQTRPPWQSDGSLGAADEQPMVRPGFQKEISLKFDSIFHSKESIGSSKERGSIKAKGSNFSAMSFSIGDMTDASNLSAVFEDSMRISDAASSPKGGNKKKPFW